MNHRIPSHRISTAIRSLLVLLLGLGLYGCGDSAGTVGAGASTGSASVFLTDAPSDDFDEILVTIEGIQLLGGGSPVTIFSGSEVVDLKELENFSDLFVHADRVPAREYSKVRLAVSRVRLLRNAGELDEVDVDADLPANGKIDLNPRGPFHVSPNVDLVIEIDMDAKKSIHVVETGVGDKYKFRPVVMVDIRDTVAPRKLARVHGEITKVIDDENFELCSTRFMATPEEPDVSPRPSYDGGLGDRHRCLMVELDGATGVFDSNGDPVIDEPLVEGQLATVIGRFHIVDGNHDDDAEIQPIEEGAPSAALAAHVFDHRAHYEIGGGGPDSDRGSDKDSYSDTDNDSHSDTDTDTDTDRDSHSDTDSDGGHPSWPDVELVMLAYVIELGPPNTFLTLRGVVESEVDGDEFDFGIAPGQGFGDDSVVSALLQIGTRIFTRGGYEVDESEIIPDTLAKIDGVFSLPAEDASLLKTALIVLDIVPDFEDELRGRIVEIEPDEMRLWLDVEEAGIDSEECVDVDDKTLILILEEDEGVASTTRGEFDDLEVGWRLDVYGESFGLECFDAGTIIAFPEDVTPIACTLNEDCELGEFCEKPDGLCESDGVCAPKPEMCPLYYDPVCGCDHETYSNACAANAAGTSIASEGECEPIQVVCGGSLGIECDEGEVCKFREGVCIEDPEGICVEAPGGCPDVWDPVCSCDGVTYGNECEALVAGAIIERPGECDPIDVVCGGSLGIECGEGEVCKFREGVCIGDPEGICVDAPDTCPDIEDPVCSCDATTYGNACEALLAGAVIERPGACQDEI